MRISGVPVGKVKTIEPNKQTGRADVEIQLQSRYAPLPQDARAILRQKTLLGETYVELTPGDTQRGHDPRGRRARRRPGVRHGRARRDPALVRPRDARELPGVDADAGAGHRRRPRAGPQRRARQPRAVRGGHGDDRRRAQPPGGGAVPARGQHGHRLRRAQRTRRSAALADREHRQRVRGHRGARQRAAGDVPRAADVRGRVAQDVRAPRRVPAGDRPAHHAAAPGRARAVADAGGPRGPGARPQEPARGAGPADQGVQGGLPGRRAGARGHAADARPARPGDRASSRPPSTSSGSTSAS